MAKSNNPFMDGKAQEWFDQGEKQGRAEAYRDILTTLEQKYMGPGRPDRGTPDGQAIISLAADIAQQLRDKIAEDN